MISQKGVTTNKKKGEQTMYTLKETQQLITKNPYTCNLNKEEQDQILNSKDKTRTFTITSKLNTEDYPSQAIDYNITEIKLKKEGETMYKLTYQEHNKLKQAAHLIMQTHNNKEYNSDKPYNQKQFIKYNQTLQILYKTKTRKELIDIIDRYQTYQEKQNNNKLVETNQSRIIIPKLQNITDTQLEIITVQIQKLEQNYYTDLDIDYTNKQSILQAYQQLLAYKHYNIPLQPRETEQILIGNTELLDKIQHV